MSPTNQQPGEIAGPQGCAHGSAEGSCWTSRGDQLSSGTLHSPAKMDDAEEGWWLFWEPQGYSHDREVQGLKGGRAGGKLTKLRFTANQGEEAGTGRLAIWGINTYFREVITCLGWNLSPKNEKPTCRIDKARANFVPNFKDLGLISEAESPTNVSLESLGIHQDNGQLFRTEGARPREAEESPGKCPWPCRPSREEAGVCHTRAGTCPGRDGGLSPHLVVPSPRQHLGIRPGLPKASQVSPWSGSHTESTFLIEIQARPSSTSSEDRQLGTAHHAGSSCHAQGRRPRPGPCTQAGTQGMAC